MDSGIKEKNINIYIDLTYNFAVVLYQLSALYDISKLKSLVEFNEIKPTSTHFALMLYSPSYIDNLLINRFGVDIFMAGRHLSTSVYVKFR